MEKHPFIFSDQWKYRIRRHLSFWISWCLFFAFLYSYTAKYSFLPDFRRLPVSLVDAFFFMIPHIFLSYILMYFVIPRFAIKAKYVAAALSVLVGFFITACISAVIGVYILPEVRFSLFAIPYSDGFNSTFLLSLLAGLRGAITIGGLAAAIKMMKYWYIKEQRNLQLQKENAEAGLQLLKAQIHPHFLFNTLNNIYAHTQKTSPIASGMITELSDLLRYTLQEGNKRMVPLDQELRMIQDYIDLEKVRYGNRLELHVQMPENANEFFIAPLLLLPLVENCFKHGTSHVLDQPWIHLHINIANSQMQMKLLNGKIDQPVVLKQTGIGLKNVQKRLSLLYSGKHELNIVDEHEVFIINLKLDLEARKDIAPKEKSPDVFEYV